MRLRHYSKQDTHNNDLIGAFTHARQPDGRTPNATKVNNALHHSSYNAASRTTTAQQDVNNAALYAQYVIIATQEEILRPQHDQVMEALKNNGTLEKYVNSLQVPQAKVAAVSNEYINQANRVPYDGYALSARFMNDGKIAENLVAEFAAKTPHTGITNTVGLTDQQQIQVNQTSVSAHDLNKQQQSHTGFNGSNLLILNNVYSHGNGSSTSSTAAPAPVPSTKNELKL